jgi:hypothetical protein
MWAFALSAGAGYSYARYADAKAPVDQALSAKPGLAHVDLTRPGSVTVPVPQSPGTHPHGVAFYLELGGDSSPDKAHRLKGLRGSVTLTDDTGAVVELRQLDESVTPVSERGNLYNLGFSPLVPSSGYTMTVTVEAGSPAMVGTGATVYGRYMVCEMELLPALQWGLLACSAGVPAMAFWLVAVGRAIRTQASVATDQA